MSDVFISNIERMTQVLPIQAAVVEYEREFARAVEQVKHDSEHNRYVERAKEYVAEHIDCLLYTSIPFRAGERQCFIEAVKGWSGYCAAVGCNEK